MACSLYCMQNFYYLCQGDCFTAICLLATSRKIYRSEFWDNFTKDVSLNKEENIKFWKTYMSRSQFGLYLSPNESFPEMYRRIWNRNVKTVFLAKPVVVL